MSLKEDDWDRCQFMNETEYCELVYYHAGEHRLVKKGPIPNLEYCIRAFGLNSGWKNEQRLREAIEQARHEWQAAVIEAAATECDKRADELREGAHAHYIDPYTEQRETAYLEAKLLAERLRCRLTTADIAAAREKMIAEAVTVEREKWTKLTHAKSGVTFDLNEIIREAAENTTANLAQGAGQSPGPAEDSQLARPMPDAVGKEPDYKTDLLNDLRNDLEYAVLYLSAARKDSREAFLVALRDIVEAVSGEQLARQEACPLGSCRDEMAWRNAIVSRFPTKPSSNATRRRCGSRKRKNGGAKWNTTTGATSGWPNSV